MKKFIINGLGLIVALGILFSPLVAKAEGEVVSIEQPEPWQNESKEIKVNVNIPGGVELKSLSVRPGDNGKYIDITDSKAIEISYNCTLFFKIKDKNNKSYEETCEVTCFDTEAPSVVAAVKDGQINIYGTDAASGIDKCYVNGYEYPMESEDLTIQLQSFDSNYKEFVVQMADKVGNVSAAYTMTNPYYATGEDEDKSGELPQDATITEDGTAFGTVVEHSNQTATINGASTIYEYDEEGNLVVSDTGKDIYTIQTQTGKTFYLIVDRSRDADNAILVSAASDNDLLHFTGTDTEVLPQNATAATLVPSTDTAATVTYVSKTVSDDATETTTVVNSGTMTNNNSNEKKSNNAMAYIIVFGVVVIVGAVGYYVKIYKPKHSYHQADEDDEEEEETSYYSQETE